MYNRISLIMFVTGRWCELVKTFECLSTVETYIPYHCAAYKVFHMASILSTRRFKTLKFCSHELENTYNVFDTTVWHMRQTL